MKSKPTAPRRNGPISKLARSLAATAQATLNEQISKPVAPPGMPVQHIRTFASAASVVGQVYRNPDEAWRHSKDNARFMRNDPLVMECIEARQRGTVLLPWHLETDDATHPGAEALINALTDMLQRIDDFTEYRRCLMEAIWYGRQAVQQSPGDVRIKGRRCIIPREWSPISGDKLAFKWDSSQVGVRLGFANYGPNLLVGGRERQIEFIGEYGKAYLLNDEERSRVVIHKHMIEDADFADPNAAGAVHGIGIRSRIYWTWFQKQSILALLMEYIERSALGFDIWTYPWGNPEAESKMREAAEQRVGNNRNIVLVPVMAGQEDLFRYEHHEPGLAGADLVNSIIHQFYEYQIKRYILGQILSSEPEGSGLGGSGMADLHQDSMRMIIEYDSQKLAETLTRELIGPLRRWNRHVLPEGTDDLHVRFVIDTAQSDTGEVLDGFQKAWSMNTPISEAMVYDALGTKPPTVDDKILAGPSGPQQPESPADAGQSLFDHLAATVGDQEEAGSLYDQLSAKFPERYTKRQRELPFERYAKEFKESEHPRDGGKFAEKPGAEKGKQSGKNDKADKYQDQARKLVKKLKPSKQRAWDGKPTKTPIDPHLAAFRAKGPADDDAGEQPARYAAEFDESKHKRAPDGKFGEGGKGDSKSKAEADHQEHLRKRQEENRARTEELAKRTRERLASKPATASPQAGASGLSPEKLKTFASGVAQLAAASPPEHRPYDNKVFISSLFETAQKKDPSLTLPAFKQQLIEANSAGLLQLGRADMVQNFDPQKIKDSSTEHLNAQFHFVILDQPQKYAKDALGHGSDKEGERHEPGTEPHPLVAKRVAALEAQWASDDEDLQLERDGAEVDEEDAIQDARYDEDLKIEKQRDRIETREDNEREAAHEARLDELDHSDVHDAAENALIDAYNKVVENEHATAEETDAADAVYEAGKAALDARRAAEEQAIEAEEARHKAETADVESKRASRRAAEDDALATSRQQEDAQRLATRSEQYKTEDAQRVKERDTARTEAVGKAQRKVARRQKNAERKNKGQQ